MEPASAQHRNTRQCPSNQYSDIPSLYCLLTSLLISFVLVYFVLCFPQPPQVDIQPLCQLEELARYGSSTTVAQYLISSFEANAWLSTPYYRTFQLIAAVMVKFSIAILALASSVTANKLDRRWYSNSSTSQYQQRYI